MEHTHLQSPRCKLKLVEQKHTALIHKGLSNNQVTQFYDVHFPTLIATQEQMRWYENLLKTETGCWWVVFGAESNNFYGAIGFNNWQQEHKKAEIGCWLLPKYWGKGLMTELFHCLIQYGFSTMDINRIEGYVDALNVHCKNALKKLNFKHEGTLRESELKNGAFLDIEIYSILKPKQK